MADIALPFLDTGPAPGDATDDAPIVLLHGFAGDARGFSGLSDRLAPRRRTIAFDLPGHGRALDWPRIGGAGAAARAVAGSLDVMEVPRAHVVGHSMGGAAACLLALKAPERVASMTLLAPGGFGTEINHALLRHFASAREASVIHLLFEQFFGPDFVLPPLVVRQAAEWRAHPGVVEPLVEIVKSLLDGPRQQVLPLEDIAALGIPVRLVWGTSDKVLPVTQARDVPGVFGVHVFDRMGHMPHLERTEAVARIIGEQVSST